MDQLTVSTVAELKSIIASYGTDVLFRGQTSYYGKPGSPTVGTSFDRQGCIPSEMLRWCQYAKNVLDIFLTDYSNPLESTQALLQHYGWRSFYIDCSTDSTVGTWFASHVYSEDRVVEMSEDYEERPVWLRKRMANYAFEEGEGHLFILDKARTAKSGLVDLARLKIAGRRCRTDAQSAWLIGPMQKENVPADCFLAHVKADRSVLRDYAAELGKKDTPDLFPPPAEDPILHSLLGLPWREISGIRDSRFDIPAFRRGLELPEYTESYVKIAWPRTAFFTSESVADAFDSIDGDPFGGVVIAVPAVVLFGSADDDRPMKFPKVEALIRDNGTVAFEIDDLIKHPNMGDTQIYQKGIGVMAKGEDLFEIYEMMVEHPGLDLIGAGFNRGWYYRRQADGLWVRERHPEECDCGRSTVHQSHVSALHIAEAFLDDPRSFG